MIVNKEIRGFTLIELLVVITIIGILSSVVLVSLGSSQDLAKDNASKAEIGQLRALSALFFNKNQDFDGFCSIHDGMGMGAPAAGSIVGNDDVTTIMESINERSGETACNSDGPEWVAGFVLASEEEMKVAWCIDSKGNAKEVSNESPVFITPSGDNAFGVIGVTACP